MNNKNQDYYLDHFWRDFFRGHLHLSLAKSVCEVSMNFLHYCNDQRILTHCERDRRYLEILDKKDLSEVLKLSTYRFETIFENKFNTNIKGTFSVVFKSYLNRSKDTSFEGIPELKQLVFQAMHFESICSILSNARNTNAHVHTTLNDMGHSLITAGAVLRLLELFDINCLNENEKKALKNNSQKIVTVCAQLEGSVDVPVTEISVEKEIHEPSGIIDEKEPSSLIPSEQNSNQEKDTDMEDQEDSTIPEITNDLSLTKEQNAQVILQLRIKLLEAGFQRQICVINRQVVSEILAAEVKTIEEFNQCPSVQYLTNNYPDEVEKQMRLVQSDLLKILN